MISLNWRKNIGFVFYWMRATHLVCLEVLEEVSLNTMEFQYVPKISVWVWVHTAPLDLPLIHSNFYCCWWLWSCAAGWEVRSYNCCYGTCIGHRRRILHRKCKSYRSPGMVVSFVILIHKPTWISKCAEIKNLFSWRSDWLIMLLFLVHFPSANVCVFNSYSDWAALATSFLLLCLHILQVLPLQLLTSLRKIPIY